MFRVTTPTHTFILDTDPREWTEFFITYKQRGIVILELTEANADRMIMEETEDGYSLAYKLTQEETSLFSPGRIAQVQIRCRMEDGTVAASEIADIEIVDVFNKEIIT